MGVQAALGRAQLQGVDGIAVILANMEVRLNQAGGTGATLDWSQGGAANPLGAAGLSLATGEPGLSVGGTAALRIADVLHASATLSVTRGVVSGVVVPGLALGATLGGSLMSLRVRDARIHVGSGASLVTDVTSPQFGMVTIPDAASTAAVGFGITGGALDIGVLRVQNGGQMQRFVGVEATLGRAQLFGVPSVQAVATNLQVNLKHGPKGLGAAMDWRQAGLSAAGVDLDATSPEWRMGGTLGFSIANVVFGSATVEVARMTVEGVDDPDDPSMRVLGGDLLTIAITNGKVYVGSGAALDLDEASAGFGTVTLPSPGSADAVGFAVEGASLAMGVFTAKTGAATERDAYVALPSARKYTGLSASMARAQLQGVEGVQLVATRLVLQQSTVPTGGVGRLDWTQTELRASNVGLLPTDAPFLIGGTAGIALGDLVYANARIEVERSQVAGIQAPNEGGGLVSGELLVIRVRDASLFVGSGASLDLTAGSPAFGTVTMPSASSSSALGFAVSGGAMGLAVLRAGGVQYLGVSGSIQSARLEGMDSVAMIATQMSLRWTRVSQSGWGTLDWTQGGRLDNPLASACLSISSQIESIEVAGTVGLGISDVVFASATLSLRMGTVSGIQDPDGPGTTLLRGDVLAITVSNASFFVGNGPSLEMDATKPGYGTVVGLNEPDAVGFAASSGSLRVAVFTAKEAASAGGAYSGLPARRTYRGVHASLGLARLQGLGDDVLRVIASNLRVQVNTVAGGTRLLDWRDAGLGASAMDLGSDTPFSIGGSAGISVAGVVLASADIELERGTVSAVDDPDDGGSRMLRGDLMVIRVTNASLFVGEGGSLDAQTGAVTLPSADSGGAAGFLVSGGALAVGIFSATHASQTGGGYASQAARQYLGVSGSVGMATLVGMDPGAVSLAVRNLAFKYHRTSVANGGLLNWQQASLMSKGIEIGPSDPPLLIGGSLQLEVAGTVKVSGDMSYSRETDTATGRTLTKIGLANGTGSAGADEFVLKGGTLGLVMFGNAQSGASMGYALDGRMTGYAATDGVAAEATIRVRKNTTTFAVNETVKVMDAPVAVVFAAGETGGVSLADSLIRLGDITVRGGYETKPNGPNGESIQVVTGASLEFGNPALLTLQAASVTYKSYAQSVTLDGTAYATGAQQVIVLGGTIRVGSILSMSGNFNIIRPAGASSSAPTKVAFAGMTVSIVMDGRTLISITGNGAFEYGGSNGFRMSQFGITNFSLLPDTDSGALTTGDGGATAGGQGRPVAPAGDIDANGELTPAPDQKPKTYKLGPLTLGTPTLSVGGFAVTYDTASSKIKVTADVSIGVSEAPVTVGGFSASIQDGPDADKSAISGTFTMGVFVDPSNGFAPEWGGLDGFSLKADQLEITVGSFLKVSGSDIQYHAERTATGKGAYNIQAGDVADVSALVARLKVPVTPFEAWVATNLSDKTQQLVDGYAAGTSAVAPVKEAILSDLNKLVTGSGIYTAERFAGVSLDEETRMLKASAPKGADVGRLNRLLIEDGFGTLIGPRNEALFYFGELAAEVTAGSVSIGGSAKDFSIMADGRFKAGQRLGFYAKL